MRIARKKPAGAGNLAAAAESRPETPRWRLPSGQTLAEFALRSGLLARRLMEPVRKGAARRNRADVRANA
jgi:hypothetical protein